MNRNWLALLTLVVASIVGNFFSRSSASSVDRERLLQAGAQVVAALPGTIGPWRSNPAKAVAEEDPLASECRGSASLAYVNSETGEQVSLLLVIGSTAPLIGRTPEACCDGTRFEVLGAPQTETISSAGNASDRFHQVTFRSRSDSSEIHRLYLAWHRAQGAWEAPQNPRLSLGAEPVLFQLQLTTRLAAQTSDAAATPDAARHFLDDLLPVINGLLNNL
jgi:hypothetical protein